MSESVKASRSTVTLGSLTIDGFMLPNGAYRMSQTQTAECVGKSRQGMSGFLKTKVFNRLLGEAGGMSGNSQPLLETFVVEIGEQGSKGETRIVGLPLMIVFIYWAWESFRGNKQALSLIVALGTEALERRFDNAFGVTRSEDEINSLMIERMAHDAEMFAAFEEISAGSSREQYLMQQLIDNGIEPYSTKTRSEPSRD